MITVDSARLPRANVTAGGIRARIVAIRPAIAGTRGRAVALEAAVVGTSEAAIVRVMARRSTLVAATRVTGMGRLRTHQIAPITAILIAIRGIRAAVLPVDAVHRMVATTTRNGRRLTVFMVRKIGRKRGRLEEPGSDLAHCS